MSEQLSFNQKRAPDCPFIDFIDDDDDHCNNLGFERIGYDCLDENDKRLGQWLADIKSISFENIIAKPFEAPNLPPYIPGVTRGSQKILNEVQSQRTITTVAVTLENIININKDNLYVISDVRAALGLMPETRLILLCYCHDRLLEKIWPIRHQIFRQIKKSNFDLVTGVNYSIWLDQPHAERLINLKRNILTFSEMQNLNIPVIPHVYWSGMCDVRRIAKWINKNPVNMVALNLQTIKTDKVLWDKNLSELKTLNSLINKPMNYLITGPTIMERIKALKATIPSFSLTNSALTKAINHKVIREDTNCHWERSNQKPSDIFIQIVDFYSGKLHTEATTKNIKIEIMHHKLPPILPSPQRRRKIMFKTLV